MEEDYNHMIRQYKQESRMADKSVDSMSRYNTGHKERNQNFTINVLNQNNNYESRDMQNQASTAHKRVKISSIISGVKMPQPAQLP